MGASIASFIAYASAGSEAAAAGSAAAAAGGAAASGAAASGAGLAAAGTGAGLAASGTGVGLAAGTGATLGTGAAAGSAAGGLLGTGVTIGEAASAASLASTAYALTRGVPKLPTPGVITPTDNGAALAGASDKASLDRQRAMAGGSTGNMLTGGSGVSAGRTTSSALLGSS